jgi:hypothetical protein
MGKLKSGIIRALDTVTFGAFSSEFLEAAGLTGKEDDDMYKYRRLTSKGDRDMAPLLYSKASNAAFHLWQRNGLANRMIQIIVDFVVYDMTVNVRIMKRNPDGSKVATDKKNAQVVWDDFCGDPVNNFYAELPTLEQDLLLFGELLLPVDVNSYSGLVRYGYIDTKLITKVTSDSSGKQAETVSVRIPGSTDEKSLNIIRYQFDAGMKDNPADPTAEPTKQALDGDAFFFRLNRVMNQDRGHGELIALLDWIDGLDQFMFNTLNGAALANSFFYTCEMMGKNQDELDKITVKTPSPASVRVHNEKVKWDVKTPNLSAIDTSASVRMFKNFILAGKGYPEHWFADGGNTNLATADNMSVPVMRMLKRHQEQLKQMVKMIAAFVVSKAPVEYVKLEEGEFIDVQVGMYDFERKDASVVSAAFRDIVGALTVAQQNNWISEDKAKEVVDMLVGRLGATTSAEETVEQVREKNKNAETSAPYVNADPKSAFNRNANTEKGPSDGSVKK